MYRFFFIVILSVFPGTAFTQNTALVIVDIQSAYFDGGASPLVNPEEASMEAAKILDHFRNTGQLVVHVQHNAAAPGLIIFQDDTANMRIHEYVFPVNGEPVITKAFPNSFRATSLDSLLSEHGIKQLVICGMMTHMCIDATVRAAKGFGYDITLIEDACATKDIQWDTKNIPADKVHEVFVAALNGYYAKVIAAEEWLKKYD